MYIFHSFSIYFILQVGLVCRGDCPCEEDEEDGQSPNVGTVLFRDWELGKDCWSKEEVALLISRKAMQELVPKKPPRDVPLLLEYIRNCLEAVKRKATSKPNHQLVMLALSDALGGYLYAYGLPVTDRQYYMGEVSYFVVKQMHELLDAFKQTLRTNGEGWARPALLNRSHHILPLVVAPHDNPCANVITTESCRKYLPE